MKERSGLRVAVVLTGLTSLLAACSVEEKTVNAGSPGAPAEATAPAVSANSSAPSAPLPEGEGAFALGDADEAPILKVAPDGILSLADVRMLVDYRDGRSTQQDKVGAVDFSPERTQIVAGQLWQREGEFLPKTSSQPLGFAETLKRAVSDAVDYEFFLTGEIKPEATARWVLRLPSTAYAGAAVLVDDKPVTLPKKPGDFSVGRYDAQTLALPVADGMLTLSAPTNVLVGDNRFYHQEHFSLILEQQRDAKTPGERAYSSQLSWRPFRYVPLSLAPVANMGFADEVAGDQQGGWNDQGADHDLASFPVGEQTFGGVLFSITDPAANDGRGCLVFAGPQRMNFLKEATVQADGEPLRTLFLLHAFAWDQDKGTPLGELVVSFADGTTQALPVTAHVEASNWTAAYDAPNGRIVWRGDTGSHEAGLSLSQYALPGKPVESIRFVGSGQAVWMVAGLTGSTDPVPPATSVADEPMVMVANEDWGAYPFEKDIVPGTMLDFSGFVDAPAGKHGHVEIRDGHFVFADRPGEPLRFWGTNIVWGGNFIEKPLAEQLARRLAMMGYNSVRFHHSDRGMLRDNPASSHDIDPEQLDLWDYLFYCMKKEGLYVTIDLFSSRVFKAGEIEEVDVPVGKGIKAAVTISPSAMEAWKIFARKLMTHRNPYTGMTYAEDPALFAICPINENVQEVFWSSNPSVAQLYNRRFDEWLESNHMTGLSDDERALAFVRFQSELQIASEREIHRFLKDELGVQAQLTDVNHRDYKPLTLTRDNLDYVDVHRYWDHPRFAGAPWQLPYLHTSESVITALAEVPRVLFPTRVAGRPFAVTEFNYSHPNPFRGEAGPIMGAYSAFQDWDAIYRFNYSGSLTQYLTQTGPIVGLNTINDPVGVLADRLIALLFLRRDVAPASEMIVYEINPDTLFSRADNLGSYSQEFSTLGLVSGLGTVVTDGQSVPNLPIAAEVVDPGTSPSLGVESFENGPKLLAEVKDSGLIDPALMDTKKGRYESETGEIVLDAGKNIFTVLTPRTEAFVLPQPGTLKGDFATVKVEDAATVAVCAMDGKPLSASSRLLILHLTEAQSTGSRFRNAERKIIETWGDGPPLVRRGTARLTLPVAPATARVWALDMTGERLWEVPLKPAGSGSELTLTSVSPQGVALAYELEIVPPGR